VRFLIRSVLRQGTLCGPEQECPDRVFRCRECGYSAQTELDGCPACGAGWKAIDVSHGPACPKNLLEEAMDTPNGVLVRRCFPDHGREEHRADDHPQRYHGGRVPRDGDDRELALMLEDVVKPEVPWTLGEIPEGWEWLAFTFNDQPEIGLSEAEIETMLRTSDAVAKRAYMRMRVNTSHRWAQHTPAEVAVIIRECELTAGSTVLDIGCGSGRHVMELAKHGIFGTGVDYLPEAIEALTAAARDKPWPEFLVGDARDLDLGKTFCAVLCLYDVIGSYADDNENARIINSVRRHLRRGGRALMSVMNFDLTFRRARHLFTLKKEPNRLLQLPASATMETSGNVFNPDYYMIDEVTEIVYRKEQFTRGTDLPAQLLVRDRRYRRRDIEAMCMVAGLDVLWSRYVRAGQWDVELNAEDDNAKEILLLCQSRD
jgi:SAM-dependent methyltransferase